MNMKLFGIVFFTSFLLAACAHIASPRTVAGTSEEGYAGPYIDAHAHFDGDENGPSEKMLAEFKKNNVVGAVVHAGQKKGAPDILTAPLPRFAVCAAVVPGKRIAEVQKGIDEKRYHCMKIYLGYIPKYASDPFYKPFYKLAEKKNVPVVFHTGDTYDKMAMVKYADPLGVDEIAVTYPKVKFVIAHMGNPWVHSAAEVVYKNDNVYVDLSALMIGDIKASSAEATEELIVKPIRWFMLFVENPKKLMFGTDWPLTDVGPYLEAVKKAIPKEHWKAVFHDNAVELFPSLRP